ncbi:MAG: type IV fimbrial biogenesis protein FimT [Arenicella sp.]|jgi:type IV fimbrial biogenesis protein FimT
MGMTKLDLRHEANSNGGFSLMELMITLSITATLASIAAPSFASMISDGRIKAASVQLSTTLAMARNHALSSTTTVIVCQAQDATMQRCSDAHRRNTRWSSGIITYADLNADNSLDENDQILTTLQSHESISMVFNQNGRLRFFADGSARSAGFYLCSKRSDRERHLKILHTGRTRTAAKLSDRNRETCLSKAD